MNTPIETYYTRHPFLDGESYTIHRMIDNELKCIGVIHDRRQTEYADLLLCITIRQPGQSMAIFQTGGFETLRDVMAAAENYKLPEGYTGT